MGLALRPLWVRLDDIPPGAALGGVGRCRAGVYHHNCTVPDGGSQGRVFHVSFRSEAYKGAFEWIRSDTQNQTLQEMGPRLLLP